MLGTAPDTVAGAVGAVGADGADVEKTAPEGGAAGMSLADVGRGRKREGEELGRANVMEEEEPISAPDDLWGEDDWSWLCEGEGDEVWWCGVIRAEGGPG